MKSEDIKNGRGRSRFLEQSNENTKNKRKISFDHEWNRPLKSKLLLSESIEQSRSQ